MGIIPVINVEFGGADLLNARLEKLSQVAWFDPFIKDLAQHTYDDVEKGYAKHSKTGMLERSLGDGVEKVAEHSYRIRSDGQIANYNVFLEFGTRPHEIRPNKRKALRWVGGNSFIFAKFVKHPGTQGDPIFTNAATNALRDFDAIASKYLTESYL